MADSHPVIRSFSAHNLPACSCWCTRRCITTTTRRPARMGHERRPTPPPGGYEQQGVAVCGPPITQAPCLPTYHSVHRLVLLGDVRRSRSCCNRSTLYSHSGLTVEWFHLFHQHCIASVGAAARAWLTVRMRVDEADGSGERSFTRFDCVDDGDLGGRWRRRHT